jgi:hypothetical protein
MNDSLTATTIIASILSLVFAVAAIWNSRVRRKHLEGAISEKKPETSSRAERFVVPIDNPPPPAPAPEPVPVPAPESAPAQTQLPIFRRIIPTGTNLDTDSAPKKDNPYVWE